MTIAVLYADDLLDLLLGAAYDATVFPNLATFDVGLSSTDPTAAGGNITEPTDPSYARVSMPNDGTTWATSSAGIKTTVAAVTFPLPAGSWGNVSYWFMIDTASTLVCAGAIVGGPVSIGISATAPSFAAGELSVTLS